jgi:hypothetical protein
MQASRWPTITRTRRARLPKIPARYPEVYELENDKVFNVLRDHKQTIGTEFYHEYSTLACAVSFLFDLKQSCFDFAEECGRTDRAPKSKHGLLRKRMSPWQTACECHAHGASTLIARAYVANMSSRARNGY